MNDWLRIISEVYDLLIHLLAVKNYSPSCIDWELSHKELKLRAHKHINSNRMESELMMYRSSVPV